MSLPDQTKAQQQQDINLKDLILEVIQLFRFLWTKFWTIAIFGALGAGLGFTYAYLQKPQYDAKLTFVLEDTKSSSLSSYAGLASQFGVDLGGNTSSGIFTGENIIAFLQSRLMIEKTLLSPTMFNNKTISLADYYVEVFSLRKSWSKDSSLKNISFSYKADRNSFTQKQDSLLGSIYETILKNNLFVSKLDKKLSFIVVECVSGDQQFSKIFTETLVKEATDFYISTKLKRSKTNVEFLQAKADSLERLLNQKTYSAAAASDLNLNPARQVATINTQLASRDKMILQTMYSEVVKNLEISRSSMAQETPLIQIVDTPILPLKKIKLGKLKGLLIGGITSGILTIFALFAIRLYRKIMNNN